MKSILVGLSALFLYLSLCCAQPAPVLAGEQNAGEVVFGMSAAFTGPSRGLGIELYRGSMAYFNSLNLGEGGLYGRKVRIYALDDGYNPNPAIRNTIEFISDPDVLLLLDYVGTPTVTRVLPLLKKYSDRHILLFFPFTGAQPQRENPYSQFVFNLRASYRHETRELVDKLLALGRRRIAVFYQADAYGRSGWDGVGRALAEHGVNMVAEVTYRRGAEFRESMDRQVEIIMQAAPDAVISIGSYQACAAFIRDARDAGFDAPIANLSFVGSENLLAKLQSAQQESGKDYCRDLINTQVVPSYEDLSLPVVREYRSVMDTYAPPPPAGLVDNGYKPFRYSFVSFEGFLNARVLAAIIKRYGEVPTPDKIKEAAESLHDFDLGIGEPVSFAPDRHQGLDKVYFTTVKDGKFVPISQSDWERWTK